MSKQLKKPSSKRYKSLTTIGEIQRYQLVHNGLTVLFVPRPGTGVVSSHIVYKVGSRDEGVGETGIAHMLEHMLFKPTNDDIANKRESHAMCFEKETGVILNANTWRDRTTYFFSYPKAHFKRAITIEAERMRGLVLTDKEFLPERNNVLSEFDMVNGDPYFAVSNAMHGAAFLNHGYRHEVIGFREDIEGYTVAKLSSFYDRYYWPNNATIIVVGDITKEEALEVIEAAFATIPSSPQPIPRLTRTEPVQQGIRRTAVNRPSTTSIFALGAKHPGVRERAWYHFAALGRMLTEGPDSILERALVDTGIASAVGHSIEPGQEGGLFTIFITLADAGHKKPLEPLLLKLLAEIDIPTINRYLKKIKAYLLTSEVFTRSSSLGFADELVEYVSADAVDQFYETERIIDDITAQDIKAAIKRVLDTNNQTIGTFNYPRTS